MFNNLLFEIDYIFIMDLKAFFSKTFYKRQMLYIFLKMHI